MKPMQNPRGRARITPRFYGIVLLPMLMVLLVGGALLSFVAAVAEAGGPGEQPRPGSLPAWQLPSKLDKALEERAIDVRMFTGALLKMFTHTHDGRLVGDPFSRPGLARPAAAGPSPTAVTDAWSPAVTWAVGGAAQQAIHAALLPNGKLSFVAFDKTFTMTPTPIGESLPVVHQVEAQQPPLDLWPPLDLPSIKAYDTLYCTAHTFLSDGRLLMASGSRVLEDKLSGQRYILGLGTTLVGDGSTWTRQAPMVGKGIFPEAGRWYPTATRLADKRVLLTAGYESVQPWVVKNLSAEVYDPALNTWSLITPQGALPADLFSYQYTHVFQLPVNTPRGDVLAFGDPATPGYMRPNGQWTMSTAARPNALPVNPLAQNGGASSMLPIRVNDQEWGYHNGSVIVAGGQKTSPNVRKIDVYDPISDQWILPRDMGQMRHHVTSTVLPDGRILLLGGEDFAGSAGLGRAQYIDPRNGFSVTSGTDEYPEVRGYHNVVLLLPDGRVMFGSGNADYTRGELPSFRYYSPSYMFGPRPRLDAVQPVLPFGSYGWLVNGNEPAPSEVVLIGLGSMTHSFDMNGRYVQLPILHSGQYEGLSFSIFGTPANSRIAPPGPYMLFVLNQDRVPSVAKIVYVQ